MKDGEKKTERVVLSIRLFFLLLKLYPCLTLDTLKDEDGEPDSLATTSDSEHCCGSEQLLWFRLELE